MNVLSRYVFITNYNAEKLTKQQANQNGVGTSDFSKCDANGDGEITIDEILANQSVCDKILKAIQDKIDKLSKKESELKTEQTKEKNEPSIQFKLAA